MPYPSIILFGDSLTEQSFSLERGGHGAALSNAYARRADVLNRGLSGYNSDWLLPFLNQLLVAQPLGVLLWIIMVGANDACLPGFVHHVPLERFKQNLKKMVSSIIQYSSQQSNGTKTRILLVSPPPIDVEMLKQYGPRGGADRSAEVMVAYADAVLEVGQQLAKDHDVAVLDFHELLSVTATTQVVNPSASRPVSLREYSTDGLHLGPKGYKVLFEAIQDIIERVWPDLTPENLPMKVKPPLTIDYMFRTHG
ncbi:SGNH hydrolase [Ascodesmis nigricans]|uniref:SGNH hydrolase n=1 Tax=Ascodesmis nigricans TaxID=341454 RepID=A0A4S2N8Q0_9PEZI|nr:SGNH hydrolase [Ascodesmis nigricans]